MHRIRARVVSILFLVIAMNAFAVGQPRSIPSDAADYQSVLAVAHDAVERQLGKPAALDVRQLQSLDDWAFLRAQMVGPGGRPISYEGTSFADSAKAGGVSPTYVALLRRDRGAWTIVVDRISPTDVVWKTWSKDYDAPAALFENP